MFKTKKDFAHLVVFFHVFGVLLLVQKRPDVELPEGPTEEAGAEDFPVERNALLFNFKKSISKFLTRTFF